MSFDPGRGAEIKKTRPAVVLNIPAVGILPLRIVVPITEWKPNYSACLWMVRLKPSRFNGLVKESAADGFQVKSVALNRFVDRRGCLTDREVGDIAAAVAMCLGL